MDMLEMFGIKDVSKVLALEWIVRGECGLMDHLCKDILFERFDYLIDYFENRETCCAYNNTLHPVNSLIATVDTSDNCSKVNFFPVSIQFYKILKNGVIKG